MSSSQALLHALAWPGDKDGRLRGHSRTGWVFFKGLVLRRETASVFFFVLRYTTYYSQYRTLSSVSDAYTTWTLPFFIPRKRQGDLWRLGRYNPTTIDSVEDQIIHFSMYSTILYYPIPSPLVPHTRPSPGSPRARAAATRF